MLQRILFLTTLALSTVILAQSLPDPVWIYHLIKFTDNQRAGNMRWIEIWESRAGDDRRFVMIDAQGQQNGVESTCYHALAIGSDTPMYIVDDQLIPAADAQQLFNELKNKNLIDQSELYINGRNCQAQDTDIVNGVAAQKCTFENEDAANLFLIKPPATSTGELWTAINGRYPVSYHFSATGSNGTVEHRYEVLPPPSGFRVDLPVDVRLQCFDSAFPIPANTKTITSGLNFATFESSNDVQTLQRYYDEYLIPVWESAGNNPRGGRSYKRTLTNGTQCSMTLQFGAGRGGKTFISADVYPASVNIESFDLPDTLASPVVIQSAMATFSISGSVQDAISQILPDFEASGWIKRPELSDIREASAFITLMNATDNTEMHIIIDSNGTTSSVNLQTRDPMCGERFAHP